MRRTLLLLLVALPAAGAGTLVAHAAAYELVGAPADGVHGYLAHLPQVLAILLLPALLAAAVAGRSHAPRAWPFAAAALSAFAIQEHVERLAHSGSFPLLLDRPVFWVGLALQVPFALAAWFVARALLRVAAGHPARRSAPPAGFARVLRAPAAAAPRAGARRVSTAPRAPPLVLPAR